MKKMITSAEKAGKIIKKINEGQNNSLLINERAINLPAFVVQNMHEVLVKDLESLKEEDAETYEKVCSGYVWVSSWVQKKKEK